MRHPSRPQIRLQKRDKAQKFLDVARKDDEESQKLRNEVHRYTDEIAVAGCRGICKEMQRKLPRELRDMVYQHILVISDNHECDVVDVYKSHGTDSTPPYPSHYGISPHPHVCDRKFVGNDTLNELAETWYRLSIFNLSFRADVSRLLTHNIWALKFNPITHIRRINVQYLPSLDSDSHFQLFQPKNLNWLTMLKKPAEVDLKVDTELWLGEADDQKDWFFTRLSGNIRTSFPDMQRMLDRGLEFTVTFDGCQPTKIQSEDLRRDVWWDWVASAVRKQSGRGLK